MEDIQYIRMQAKKMKGLKAERLGNGLGDSLGLSLTFESQNIVNKQSFAICKKDKNILRELAGIIAGLAARPEELNKKSLWYRLNRLEKTRPLVFCDPENGWYEIITPDQLKCEGNLARIWEFKLRKEIFWAESMGDDRVIVPYFNIQYVFSKTDRGMRETIIGGDSNGSYIWDPPLKNYDDIDKLFFSQFIVDKIKTEELLNMAEDVFGGILGIRLEGCWWWSFGMTQDLIKLIGLEKFMIDMYDCPENIHHLMSFLRDENLKNLELLERDGLLTANNEDTYIASGGFGWTNELPQEDYNGTKIRAIDMWGFGESQESVGVGPEMFEEFVFQYQLPLLEKFGLNCYGCCEPLDKRWNIVKKTPRLRRVSVSNWADEKIMAEQLCENYIYSKKAPSASLALPKIDEDSIRIGLRNTVNIARQYNCRLEIIMKDNHTIGQNPQNVINWCRIAQEEAAKL